MCRPAKREAWRGIRDADDLPSDRLASLKLERYGPRSAQNRNKARHALKRHNRGDPDAHTRDAGVKAPA